MLVPAKAVATQPAINTILTNNHIVYTSAYMLDLNHNRIADISYMFSDGQVNIDGDAENTRSLSMTLFDPRHMLGLDSTSPADGALFLDRMVQTYRTCVQPETGYYYTVPTFCGPLTKADRDFAWISVEAQGKEAFGLREAWLPKTYKKGALKTEVIKDILRKFLGESNSKMSIPNLSAKLSSDYIVSQERKPWESAKSIARGLGYQLFYDARGVAVMRKWPSSSVFTFTEGAGGTILTKPQVGYDMDNLVNAVYVKGAVPKGKKTPITAKRVAPSSHPLSPAALGRGGVGRYYWAKIEDTSITSQAEANERADTALRNGLLIATTLSFDSLVIPHLEPYDVVTTSTSDFSFSHVLRKYSIPLLASGRSTVGYLRNTSVNKSRIRKAR